MIIEIGSIESNIVGIFIFNAIWTGNDWFPDKICQYISPILSRDILVISFTVSGLTVICIWSQSSFAIRLAKFRIPTFVLKWLLYDTKSGLRFK